MVYEGGWVTVSEVIALSSPVVNARGRKRYYFFHITLSLYPSCHFRVARYAGKDTWNVLDALTVICALVAFIARLRAMPTFGGTSEPGGSFFLAQFFLAASAPLFFARLLLLPQIDGALGPMTQVGEAIRSINV